MYLGQPVQIFDPLNNQPFVDNIIPVSRISPQAKSLLPYYPEPNFATPRINYQVPLIQNTHTDSYPAPRQQELQAEEFYLAATSACRSRADDATKFQFPRSAPHRSACRLL